MSIEGLDLGSRAYNVIKAAGIETVEEIERIPDEKFKLMKCCGVKTVKEIRNAVREVRMLHANEAIMRIWIGD